MNFRSSIGRLRLIALVEGISCVLLFFVAMPLKYVAGLPLFVTIIGSLHGALFMIYLLALANFWLARSWPIARVALFAAASVPPLATFFLDATLRREQMNLAAPCEGANLSAELEKNGMDET